MFQQTPSEPAGLQLPFAIGAADFIRTPRRLSVARTPRSCPFGSTIPIPQPCRGGPDGRFRGHGIARTRFRKLAFARPLARQHRDDARHPWPRFAKELVSCAVSSF